MWLTRKQRWRRIRTVQRGDHQFFCGTAHANCHFPLPKTAVAATRPSRVPHHHRPSPTTPSNDEKTKPPGQQEQAPTPDYQVSQPITPQHSPVAVGGWGISALNTLRFIFFFGGGGDWEKKQGVAAGKGAARARAATEGCQVVVHNRPRLRSEPWCLPAPPRARVRFNQRVTIILVATRGELSSVKADVWWGERDYYSFRLEYINAVRQAMATVQQEAGLGNTKGREERTMGRGESEDDNYLRPSATKVTVSFSAVQNSPSPLLPQPRP